MRLSTPLLNKTFRSTLDTRYCHREGVLDALRHLLRAPAREERLDLLAAPALRGPGADLELETLERATLARQDVRRPRAPLTGPTLDDVMSRVWEGLATGVPAACPVCRGEVVASFAGSLHGSCSSCGTTIE